MDDLNHAIVAKPHTSLYLIHKYWARKPHNVVAEYIKHYSKEGEIVLDPFVGSGVTAIESLKLNRKAIAIDLNPISMFILENTLIKVDLDKVKQDFEKIKSKLKDKINEVYQTSCPRCKEKAIILATIWKKENNPTEIRCFCKNCNKRYAIKPSNEDLKLINNTNKLKSKWHPKTKLSYDKIPFKEGTHQEEFDSIDSLFTNRNLYALSLIFEEIEKVSDKKIQNLFKFAFTSMVHLASKMCPVAKEGGKGHWSALSSTSFWAVHRFWIPPIFMESNVWMLFESSVIGKQGILKGKEESNKLLNDYKKAKDFNDLKKDSNILIENISALELTKLIPKNSVDYIFTDPPYGGAIQYFELSTLWASWLNKNLNYSDEITVNKQQNKDFDYYHKMLKSAFREMYQVLKPNKYLTVTFHSTDIAVWNSIIKAVVLSGFDIEKIVYQPPARASAKGLLQPYGSAVGDYYIRFKKPKTEKIISEKTMDIESYEREVVLAAKRIIEERGEPTIYQHILNGIMVELKGGRYAPIGARKFEDILKNHVGKEFELIPIKDNKDKIIGKKWWLKDKDFSNFTTRALSDRVESVVLNVLDKKVKASFDDILQHIFIEFPNALTPDTQDVKTILEEYATKTKDGKWRLRPEEKERSSNHSRMIYYLANLGKKAGFSIWIGTIEQSHIYNGKELRTYCDNIRTFRFVPQESSTIDRIKAIDVLWLEDGRIKYEFEVENTTGISEAIIRGSHIPEDLKVKRFVVIPKERERKLNRKLQEPILAQAIKKTNWKFILYKDLENLFKTTKKKLNPIEIQKISKMPEDKPDLKQTTLNNKN